jgi:hypothetical protein
MKANAALMVNGAFYCYMDHDSGGKVGGNGRAVVDNRLQ